MIIDRIENWRLYFKGETWRKVFEFLASLGPASEEKRYVLDGDDVYAPVFSITTKAPEEGKLEAHRKYIDIQAPLTAPEGIEWYPLEGLKPQTEYDEAKDAILFERPAPAPCRVDVRPGMFCFLWPEDAHMPGLAVGAPGPVKKCVVKVRVDKVI
jgi:biofilm protein TabA